ncbi:MAG: hypothetical protein OIF50_01655 [Flavobacteriaceae bacterium]|nr:hypothetical protein [Flavobacteriaceae bacterium]
MHTYSLILLKLEAFIKKYYYNELLKGLILFVLMGLLFWLFVSFLEYLLWLSGGIRALLFWLFVIVSLATFVRYIGIPLTKLFKLRKGLDHEMAAKLIGNHFSEVSDKLTNVLQLAKDPHQSDLVLAGIEQKSKELQPIPFKMAIRFQNNLQYAKWLAIPVLVIVLLVFSGNFKQFFNSFKRVQDYSTYYEAPAPFQFVLLNKNLIVDNKMPFELQLITKGKIKPAQLFVVFNDQKFAMPMRNGISYFDVPNRLKSKSFHFEANGYTSNSYSFDFRFRPSIESLQIDAVYPSYLKKPKERFTNNGSIEVPEGTKLTWVLHTKHTEKLMFVQDTNRFLLKGSKFKFDHTQKVYAPMSYQLEASNMHFDKSEDLHYEIAVSKDQFPQISVEMVQDSLRPNIRYFVGEAFDDYAIRNIRMVYYEYGKESNKKHFDIATPNKGFERFYYTYPQGLVLEANTDYAFYFEVVDNDGVHGGKSTKSSVFHFTNHSAETIEKLKLQQQKNAIQNLGKSIQRSKQTNKQWDQFSKEQNQKNQWNFNDQRKLQNFVKRKSLEEQQMKKFSEDLKENLKEQKEDSEMKKILEERLKRQEEEFQKNQKLLEELEKLSNQIQEEELQKKLDKLSKQQSNSQRNLEQILELTKRYYVSAKLDKLQKIIENLAKEQLKQSADSTNTNTSKKQDSLLNRMKDFEKDLDSLLHMNKKLKKPVQIDRNSKKLEEIQEDQNAAKESLEQKEATSKQQKNSSDSKQQLQNAQQKQKSAATKMKQLSESLKQKMQQMSGGESMQEDIEMLRQILDNLVVFSKEEELLMTRNMDRTIEDYTYATNLRKQKQLREIFGHVDDSLLALSFRNPMIGEDINKEIGEVYYNIDKALELFADNKSSQGVSKQQFVVSASNVLANMLANSLNNMQMQMSAGSGSGSSGGSQLPDIIKSQDELNKDAGNSSGKQSGNQGQDSKDGNGKKGDGKEGKLGESGKSGEEGNNSEEGKSPGNNSKNGEKGGTSGKEDNEGSGKNGNSKSGGSSSKDGEGQSGRKGNNGESGQGNNGTKPSDQEMEMEKLYGIYKQQQQLRKALEKQLNDMEGKGQRTLTKNIIKQMEKVEDQLLEKGFDSNVKRQMDHIKHQLLKLQEASMQQGEDKQRESNTNNKEYAGKLLEKNPFLKKYLEQIELLNRQVLPLRPVYSKKVNAYFKND